VNGFLQCPKCRGTMRTYNRNGVQIEQCDQCRGIFLDYGELEALTRLESQWAAAPPPPPAAAAATHHAPAWGSHGYHGHGHRSFGRMLFSS
jgi:uncharacterized protein